MDSGVGGRGAWRTLFSGYIVRAGKSEKGLRVKVKIKKVLTKEKKADTI